MERQSADLERHFKNGSKSIDPNAKQPTKPRHVIASADTLNAILNPHNNHTYLYTGETDNNDDTSNDFIYGTDQRELAIYNGLITNLVQYFPLQCLQVYNTEHKRVPQICTLVLDRNAPPLSLSRLFKTQCVLYHLPMEEPTDWEWIGAIDQVSDRVWKSAKKRSRFVRREIISGWDFFKQRAVTVTHPRFSTATRDPRRRG